MPDFLIPHVRTDARRKLHSIRSRVSALARIFGLGATSLRAGFHVVLFDPDSEVDGWDRRFGILSLPVLFAVTMPVIALMQFSSCRHRAATTKIVHALERPHSTCIEVVVWTTHCAIVAFLGVIQCTAHTFRAMRGANGAPLLPGRPFGPRALAVTRSHIFR